MTPLPHDRLEQLIRNHLDHQAEQVDPRPGFERLQQRLGRRPVSRLPRYARWGSIAAAAACVVVAFALWPARTPAHQTTPEMILRAARKAHRIPLDRCYLVEIRKESELFEEGKPAVPVQLTRLWTRGDRFWIESINARIRWAWGRDERGRFWIAVGPRHAILCEPDEVPRWLNLYGDLLSLKPEKLLDEVLASFELTRDPASDDGTQVIRARNTDRWNRLGIRSAVLEIDDETKVIRRLTLERVRQQRLVATVTYTLVETQAQDIKKYSAEGHLVAPYEIFTRTNKPLIRLRVLKRFFGPQAGQWFGLEK